METCNRCDKEYPKDSEKWHQSTGGIQTGGGDTDEKGDYTVKPAKMCHECFEKLPEDQKHSWPEIN
ncbi:MAG: hypothetical protein COV29_00170 [Candidatus Yanofskybacteria bacterium CG10_big_fil_rev_8_21_14_0_10_36_16]|uniref:Uncharacterized protein n=1 Tax=Candidatus Yanofskybacteria bacterium CG10_big_fil_rev_8_21_14_0_10_36_16 TaxID=1975096 RepID=A0A2J0Q8I4_9BACT|nr:MAG: hypothetical protein COV29_00170 [Candidatus Yanofskybacteria bacterium CG10_big_fil_rev_8_21_14_0_10_36_16]